MQAQYSIYFKLFKMRNILFFDIAITGHHSEYIGHLVDCLSIKKEIGNVNYVFIVHPKFSKKFPAIFKKAKKIKRLTWIQITSEEEHTVKGGPMRKSFARYRIMHRYATKTKANHVCSLDFHTIKYGSILFRTKYTLSGILFVQFYRLNRNSIQEKWTYYKRYWLTKLSVANPKLTRVFVLNDQETVQFMNQKFGTNVFQMLPDPIPQYEPLNGFDVYERYAIGRDRKIFLHIGSLGSRKGTVEVVDAAKHIETGLQQEIAILLVGLASTEIEKKAIMEKVAYHNMNSKVRVVWDESFVSNAYMKSLFEQCHAVLIPYKNVEFSSGILGHAAASQKMVIATGKGLLKEMVLKYKLGLLLEEPNPIEIAEKIVESLSYEYSSDVSRKMIEKHRPSVFSQLLLEYPAYIK